MYQEMVEESDNMSKKGFRTNKILLKKANEELNQLE